MPYLHPIWPIVKAELASNQRGSTLICCGGSPLPYLLRAKRRLCRALEAKLASKKGPSIVQKGTSTDAVTNTAMNRNKEEQHHLAKAEQRH